MTTKHITAAQAAARMRGWTPDQIAAYEVGRDLADAWYTGRNDGLLEESPYGDLSAPDMDGLLATLHLTGRTNVTYRAMLADSYRAGRRRGLGIIATQWTEADDDGLAELAEAGYDDEAGQ